jgi:uncharacterized membrane protein
MALFLIIGISACSNDSEDDLINQMQNPDPITYTDDVKAIIDNNCLNCHSDPPTNGAPIPLVTFVQVKNSTENGTLISRIQSQAGQSGAMPLGAPRLPQSLIDIVVQWQADGFVE